jgi:hypothetical protein
MFDIPEGYTYEDIVDGANKRDMTIPEYIRNYQKALAKIKR